MPKPNRCVVNERFSWCKVHQHAVLQHHSEVDYVAALEKEHNFAWMLRTLDPLDLFRTPFLTFSVEVGGSDQKRQTCSWSFVSQQSPLLWIPFASQTFVISQEYGLDSPVVPWSRDCYNRIGIDKIITYEHFSHWWVWWVQLLYLFQGVQRAHSLPATFQIPCFFYPERTSSCQISSWLQIWQRPVESEISNVDQSNPIPSIIRPWWQRPNEACRPAVSATVYEHQCT